MLDAMVRLGDALRSDNDGDSLSSLIQPLPAKQGKGKKFICELAIHSSPASLPGLMPPGSMSLETRLYAVNDSEKTEAARRFLWIGNAPGSNSPQWTAATSNVAYLLSQTVHNLYSLLPKHSELRTMLEAIREHFYYDLGPQEGQMERYRYVLDLGRLGVLPEGGMERLVRDGPVKTSGSINAKSFVELLKKEFLKAVDLSDSNIYLWSLSIDGLRVSDHSDYRALVRNQKVDSVFEGENGRCAGCANVSTVTADMTRMKFKYYNTDKISFASGISANQFNCNLVLCPSCYASVLAAEAHVQTHLRARIGELQCYVVPDYVGRWEGQGILRRDSTIMVKVEHTINAQFNDMEHFEQGVEGSRSESHGTIVNLLFFEWNNAELRILDLIRDVPVSRFETLQRAFVKTRRMGERLMGESSQEFSDWNMNLWRVYSLIPVAKSSKGGSDHRMLLQLLHGVIAGRRIDYGFLIRSFVRLIVVYRYEQFTTTQVRRPAQGYELRNLERDVLGANLVFYCLRRLGQLNHSPLNPWREESDMAVEDAGNQEYGNAAMDGGQVGKDAKEYEVDQARKFLDVMGYGRPQRALFWLGYLMGKIAYVQRRGGLKSVPILEKIDYRGMDESAITKLIDRVLESARQNKLFDAKLGASTSRVLYQMYEEFGFAWTHDAVAAKWDPPGAVSKEEAVFYIMSGFSYQSQGYRRRGGVEGGPGENEGDAGDVGSGWDEVDVEGDETDAVAEA